MANQDSDVGETTYPQVPMCFAEDVAGRVWQIKRRIRFC